MAHYILFKNWIRIIIFQKIATLPFTKYYSLQFGFAVVYDFAQNTSSHSSGSVRMRIYIYKWHKVLSKLPILSQIKCISTHFCQAMLGYTNIMKPKDFTVWMTKSVNQTFHRERFLQNFFSSLKAMQELVIITGGTWKYPDTFSCLLCL